LRKNQRAVFAFSSAIDWKPPQRLTQNQLLLKNSNLASDGRLQCVQAPLIPMATLSYLSRPSMKSAGAQPIASSHFGEAHAHLRKLPKLCGEKDVQATETQLQAFRPLYSLQTTGASAIQTGHALSNA
jgi:hypothetical protein